MIATYSVLLMSNTNIVQRVIHDFMVDELGEKMALSLAQLCASSRKWKIARKYKRIVIKRVEPGCKAEIIEIEGSEK